MNYHVQIGFFTRGEREPAQVIGNNFATIAEAYAETLTAFRAQANETESAHIEEYVVPAGEAGIFAAVRFPDGEARARIVPLN